MRFDGMSNATFSAPLYVPFLFDAHDLKWQEIFYSVRGKGIDKTCCNCVFHEGGPERITSESFACEKVANLWVSGALGVVVSRTLQILTDT